MSQAVEAAFADPEEEGEKAANQLKAVPKSRAALSQPELLFLAKLKVLRNRERTCIINIV